MTSLGSDPIPVPASGTPAGVSGAGGPPAKLIVGITVAGTAATLLLDEFGVPRWVTAGAFVGYGVVIAGLLLVALCSTHNPARHWLIYRLLTVLAGWVPALAEAVRPGVPPSGRSAGSPGTEPVP